MARTGAFPAILFVTLANSGAALAVCTPQWDTSLGSPSLNYGPSTGTSINTSIMHDDGSGPALFIGGDFTTIAGSRVFGIAKSHDGNRWEPLAGGLRRGSINPGTVHAMSVFDLDGTGPNPSVLVIGGWFTQYRTSTNSFDAALAVAAWNGSGWVEGLPGLIVPPSTVLRTYDLQTYNDGTGEKLYAAGEFVNSDGLEGVAVWNGSDWASVGLTGIAPHSGWVKDLVVYDDGTGPALYILGTFPNVIGVSGTENIAKWDGTSWSSVAGGSTTRFDRGVVFDADGAGGSAPKLYCLSYGRLSIYDGETWTVQDTGLTNNGAAVVYNDGTGERLYLGGVNVDGGVSTIFRYDGATVSPIGDTIYGHAHNAFHAMFVTHLGVHTLNSSPTLFAGGIFRGTVAAPCKGMLRWDNVASNWAPFSNWGGTAMRADFPNGETPNGAEQFTVKGLKSFDLDGAGPNDPSVIVSGHFSFMGGVDCNGLAARTGSTWSTVAGGVPNAERYGPLMVRDSNGTKDLFVVAHGDAPAPTLPHVTGASVHQLVNNAWVNLGSPFTFRGYLITSDEGDAYDLAVLHGLASVNFGSGDTLFAFGNIFEYNGTPIDRVAMWNGSTWASLAPLGGTSDWLHIPTSGVSWNDGSGPALFIGGSFDGGIGKWDGEAWSFPNSGLPAMTPPNNYNNNPTVFIYNNQLMAWVQTNRSVYSWNGSEWSLISTLPSDVDGMVTDHINTFIGVADQGAGSRVYFNVSTLMPGNAIRPFKLCTFDGSTWRVDHDMGIFTSFAVEHVASNSFNGETSLWVGGGFGGVNGVLEPGSPAMSVLPSSGVARWYCTAPACPADFNDSGSVTVQDIFDFLSSWFAGNPQADINNAGGVTVQDIFDFLAAWFAGC